MTSGPGASVAIAGRPAVNGVGQRHRPPIGRSRNRPTVLLAEDDAGVRSLLRRVLSEHGYAVLSACHGLEALQAARAHRGDVDLLVTDIVMPALGGVELARTLRERRPQLPVLYVSGYAAEVAEPRSRLLAKPFGPARLLAEVGALLPDRQPTG